MNRLRTAAAGLVFAAVGLACWGSWESTHAAGAAARSEEPKETAKVQVVQLRGGVVCLAEEMNRLFGAPLPTRHEHVFGFRTEEGAYYTLLRTKRSEAIFVDERFRKKRLFFRGRLFPGSQVVEVLGNIYSIRDGALHDLYYYCQICEIFSISPELCECCQGPTELVEKPLSEMPDALKH